MIDQVTFGQTHLIWPVVLGAGLLWLVFIWKEWTGIARPRFFIKMLVSLIALGALAMIALQPNIRQAEKIGYTAILSPGYQKVQVDSLKAAHKNIKVVNYRPGEDLSNNIQSGQEVFVLGQGLKSFDLWQLEKVSVQLLNGTKPSGISRLTYTQKNTVGNDFVVAGEYHKASKGRQLVLTGPGDTPLDSVQLEVIPNQMFNLKTTHLVEGKFIYTLIEKDSVGNQLSSLPLAVTIKAKNKLHILIINQFPSFETKYLKNFLAESGHIVKVRSQVSKGRYKYEYFNTQQKSSIDFTRKTLNEIDLVIIDASSLGKASKSMLQGLRTAMAEQGLGVFIQADEAMYGKNLPLLEFSFLKQADEAIILENDPKVSLTKYPFIFKNETFLEPVQQSNFGIITAYKRAGAGRIGTTVLQNTYELLLEGKTQVYQSLWSPIISGISKRKAMETVWKQVEMMSYPDAPFHFEINTAQENPLVKSQDGFSIPLARDRELRELWRGTTYPRKPGWNQLIMNQDSTDVFDFYVLDSMQWTSLDAHQTINKNKRYFNRELSSAQMMTFLKPIQPWWFFIAFLLAMSFLWLEPKL